MMQITANTENELKAAFVKTYAAFMTATLNDDDFSGNLFSRLQGMHHMMEVLGMINHDDDMYHLNASFAHELTLSGYEY